MGFRAVRPGARRSKKLGMFRPWMTHSFSEQARHLIFHGQLLSDYATIEEMGGKMLEELDG